MAKQYQVRKGYTWIGPDGKPTGATMVFDTDPGFKSQQYKLEPWTGGMTEIPADVNRFVKATKSETPGAEDRMIEEDDAEKR